MRIQTIRLLAIPIKHTCNVFTLLTPMNKKMCSIIDDANYYRSSRPLSL